jgi:hypothetical protein
LEQEYEVIKNVLLDFYVEEELDCHPADLMIFFPLGCVIYEDQRSSWTLSPDFAFIFNHVDLRINMTLVQEIIDSGIDLTVMQGYWTILNNENIVVHTIWESEIAEVMDEREMQFEEAFLSILESIEEPKKGSDNLH